MLALVIIMYSTFISVSQGFVFFFNYSYFLSPVIYFPMVQPILPITVVKAETAALNKSIASYFLSFFKKETKPNHTKQNQTKQQNRYSNIFFLFKKGGLVSLTLWK